MGSLWLVAQTESVPCARSMGAVPTLGTFKGAGRLAENIESSGKKKRKQPTGLKACTGFSLTLAAVLADQLYLVTWPRHSPPFYGSLPFAMFPDISKFLVSPESYYFGWRRHRQAYFA